MILSQCISDFTMSYGLHFSLFLAGLVGGFTHCAGMCSPFVFAQMKGGGGKSGGEIKRLGQELLLPYHVGRMTTYVTLAVLVSSVINLAFIFSGARALISAPLLILAGILFLVSAFPALGRLFPWVVRMQLAKPFSFLMKFSSRLMQSDDVFKRFGLGILLGFMPCGLVASALLASSTAQSPVMAGLAMASFAIGTMPALILVGLGGSAVQYKYPKLFTRLSRGAMVVSSLWLFALAGMTIF